MTRKPTAEMEAAYLRGEETAEVRDMMELAYEPWADQILGDEILSAFFAAGREGESAPEWVEAERYGEPPASGRSWNHADNRPEAGVSVAQVLTPGVSDYRWHMGGFGGDSRPLVKVEGWLLHHRWGSDGEPLIIAA